MALVSALLVLGAACGGAGPHCQSGYAYCMDPGGNGADLCCPVNSPYYCASDNLCHSDVFFSCSTGKVFCSTNYN
jgi:hypothetical protein